MIERGDLPEETHVVRLIHPTAELMPGSIDGGAGEISRRAGFGGTWTGRHHGFSSRRRSGFARPV